MALRIVLTGDTDLAPMAFNKLLCNEQSNPGADRRTSREKGLEHFRQIVRCNTTPLSEILNSSPLADSDSSTEIDRLPPVGMA